MKDTNHTCKHKGIEFTIVVDPYTNAIYQEEGREKYDVYTFMNTPYGRFNMRGEVSKQLFESSSFEEYAIGSFAESCYNAYKMVPINEKISRVEI